MISWVAFVTEFKLTHFRVVSLLATKLFLSLGLKLIICCYRCRVVVSEFKIIFVTGASFAFLLGSKLFSLQGSEFFSC